MISDQLRLVNAIAPTPHPRVELPQIKSQEASTGINLEGPEIFHGGHERWPYFRDMLFT